MKTLLQAIAALILFACTAAGAAPGRDEWEGLAKKGDVKSMMSLGIMYHTGDGVKVDYTKAMEWYLKAYAKNDGDALNNIGVLFRDGLGVPKNEKVAYLLFLGVHMEGLGTDATQMRAGRSLGKLAKSLKKEDTYEALSYTWVYVDQIVKSRGKNTEVGKDVLPTKKRPRIRDNGWWLDSERKKMDFESPAPWDEIHEAEQDGADQPATDTEEPTPAPPKKPLVGRWAGTGDQDNRVVVTFNSDGTYELLMVDHETPKWVKARATGRYKTDFSVSPAHLDLDMRVEEPKPEEPMTHKFEMIFEIIDENSFRMSDLTVTRPERFGNRPLVMRRQGGAGKETEPGGAGGAGRPSVSDEGSDTASVTPADPEIVPKGLEGLGLSQAQAEEFNKWLIDTGPRADPADRAKKLISILREDQLPAFQKRLHTGG